ncbi:MAG: transposase [Actinobacteria bacterium]|nr:transposase [Actinomycetota bacterium]
MAEFDQLVKEVTSLYSEAERARHTLTREGHTRQRAVGAGPRFTLGVRDQLLLTVVWLRQYPTNEVLGFLFGVSDSTVSRTVSRVVPLLARSGKDGMRMPDPGRKHRRTLEDLLREIPELGVVIDTFEQPVQRPLSKQEADKWYSGKKKRHTIKSQVGVDRNSGEIVDVGESVRGPTNDLTLLKQSKLMERLPQGVSGEGDLAYIGIATLHPQKLGFTPRRKPRGADKHRPRGRDKARPPQDIAYNTAFAHSRIVVEHTILRMRRYASLWHTDRHHRRGHSERVAAVAGLVNRQIRHRLPYLVN